MDKWEYKILCYSRFYGEDGDFGGAVALQNHATSFAALRADDARGGDTHSHEGAARRAPGVRPRAASVEVDRRAIGRVPDGDLLTHDERGTA